MQRPAPHILHQSPGRLRLRWTALRHPELRLEYLEAWLARRAGLMRVRVNPAGACLVAEFAPRPDAARDILAALAQIPPEVFVRPAGQEAPPPRRRLADALAHVALAGAATLLPAPARRPLALGLGAPALLRGAQTLASRGLKARVLDMATVGFALLTDDVPAALGISAMVVVGDYLRQATEDRSGALLKSLLAPPVASVRLERQSQDGAQEISVPFADARPGDLVLVAAGESVPVDGVVERGQALVDKSAITGEAAPADVGQGDMLLAGSVLAEGSLTLRAVRTGEACTTSRIAALMEQSLLLKSRPELLSEVLADRLVPLTLALGAGIYAATRDLRRALAVLTIDYSCAVKLSAPVVMKASMYATAKGGVLVKSGSALDALGRADTMLFDKTGTLTTGRMAVTDVLPLAGFEADELLLLAASAEERWSHPVAQALVAEAARRGFPLLACRLTDCATALGVRAEVGEACRRVEAGSGRFLLEHCGLGPERFQDEAGPGHEALRAAGKTLVHVAVEGRPAGTIALSDELRPEAASVLAGLRQRGMKRVLVLTGDNGQAAHALLRGLPKGLVDEVRAELSPEAKARVVAELRAAGARVAVVGDGVNDAPALLAADVGICVAGPAMAAAGLARDSAGIVLLRGDLNGLLAALDAARRAETVLRACFGTGVGVNTGLLLAASAGKLSPILAAALHNGTTFAILSLAALAAGAELPQKPAQVRRTAALAAQPS